MFENRRTVALAALLMFGGCGGPKHVPAAASAKAALESALAAWRDGKPVGAIEGTKPTTQAEDFEWRAKKKLTAFEIVGEESGQPEGAPRRFNVTLTIDAAPPVDAVYVVFGNDPVWVYRDKDYQTQFSKM